MAIKKSQLYNLLWASCDVLRGSMDASQYKDYVISENMFHWESQNTEAHSNRGNRYVRQHENGKRFLLFVREDKKDVFGNTAPFYCFGFVDYVSSTGDFPMSITWKTQQSILPQFLKAV